MRLSHIFAGRSRIAIVAGVSALSLAALVPIAAYVMPDRAEAAADAVLAANASGNALADLENRSPGSRMGGIATKAKRTIARLLPGRPDEGVEAPVQRALGKEFDPPATDAFQFAPLSIPGAPVMAFSAPSEGAPEQFLPIGGGGFSPGSPGGTVIPGGGGNPGGGGGTNPPPPPPPAVPEPDTWALMLLGFGFVGAVMRRQSRKGRLAAQP